VPAPEDADGYSLAAVLGYSFLTLFLIGAITLVSCIAAWQYKIADTNLRKYKAEAIEQ
jgi:hypothetical protein